MHITDRSSHIAALRRQHWENVFGGREPFPTTAPYIAVYEGLTKRNNPTMMHLRIFTIAAALPLLVLGATASFAYTGQQYAKDAKIDLVHARQIALQARPGVVTDQELERERGGSGLRYSFDIKSRGETFEVGIDAKTGRVLENSKEGRNPD